MALKVLLADDSMTAQNMGKKILTDAGFEVATVSNGAAAIKKVAEYKPDIIILDIYMPGYTGLEVCERVRATDSATPILLTVGKLEPFRQEDVEHVRADAIIIKPFEATELINTVRKFSEQVGVAASQAAVPPPAPAVELPPPPPPAQLSEEDLAFLRGEITENTAPEPPASNAGHAAANPDFADLLAAPQTQVSPSEADIPMNDFELPPLTEEDFAMLQDAANAESAPAYQEKSAVAPAIDLMGSSPAVAEPAAAILEPTIPEMAAFQLDDTLTTPLVEPPPVVYEAEAPVTVPTEFVAPVETVSTPEIAHVDEVAMTAAMPAFMPAPEVHVEPALALVPEPESVHEAQPAAEEFALELPAELAEQIPSEPLMEPILETAPTAVVTDSVEPELEPLELEQSGPQPTAEIVAPPEELAPAFEFIGATGKTPADLEIEPLPVEPVLEVEPAAFAHPESLLDVADAENPLSAEVVQPSTSQYGPIPDLLETESQTVVASTETAVPVGMDLNYATVAGVVHRVFDRYKSQMIADIVRELSERQK